MADFLFARIRKADLVAVCLSGLDRPRANTETASGLSHKNSTTSARRVQARRTVKREPEVVEGYTDRILTVSEKAKKELKKRTLTKLYNERPTWLDNAHRELDRAVAAAYGWPEDISDEDALARLMKLNEERQEKNAGVSKAAAE